MSNVPKNETKQFLVTETKDDIASSTWSLFVSPNEIEKCPDGLMFCAHGAECVKQIDSSLNELETNLFQCDCDSISTSKSYAGDHCEYEVTEFCFEGNSSQETKTGFCTNGGKCKSQHPSDNSGHPGCECPEGFVGEFCQYKAATQLSRMAVDESSNNNNFDHDHLDMRISKGEAELCLVALVTILVVFSVGLIVGTSARNHPSNNSLFRLTASRQKYPKMPRCWLDEIKEEDEDNADNDEESPASSA